MAFEAAFLRRPQEKAPTNPSEGMKDVLTGVKEKFDTIRKRLFGIAMVETNSRLSEFVNRNMSQFSARSEHTFDQARQQIERSQQTIGQHIDEHTAESNAAAQERIRQLMTSRAGSNDELARAVLASYTDTAQSLRSRALDKLIEAGGYYLNLRSHNEAQMRNTNLYGRTDLGREDILHRHLQVAIETLVSSLRRQGLSLAPLLNPVVASNGGGLGGGSHAPLAREPGAVIEYAGDDSRVTRERPPDPPVTARSRLPIIDPPPNQPLVDPAELTPTSITPTIEPENITPGEPSSPETSGASTEPVSGENIAEPAAEVPPILEAATVEEGLKTARGTIAEVDADSSPQPEPLPAPPEGENPAAKLETAHKALDDAQLNLSELTRPRGMFDRRPRYPEGELAERTEEAKAKVEEAKVRLAAAEQEFAAAGTAQELPVEVEIPVHKEPIEQPVEPQGVVAQVEQETETKPEKIDVFAQRRDKLAARKAERVEHNTKLRENLLEEIAKAKEQQLELEEKIAVFNEIDSTNLSKAFIKELADAGVQADEELRQVAERNESLQSELAELSAREDEEIARENEEEVRVNEQKAGSFMDAKERALSQRRARFTKMRESQNKRTERAHTRIVKLDAELGALEAQLNPQIDKLEDPTNATRILLESSLAKARTVHRLQKINAEWQISDAKRRLEDIDKNEAKAAEIDELTEKHDEANAFLEKAQAELDEAQKAYDGANEASLTAIQTYTQKRQTVESTLRSHVEIGMANAGFENPQLEEPLKALQNLNAELHQKQASLLSARKKHREALEAYAPMLESLEIALASAL